MTQASPARSHTRPLCPRPLSSRRPTPRSSFRRTSYRGSKTDPYARPYSPVPERRECFSTTNPAATIQYMSVQLPVGYKPSASEEFMNPSQAEYFRRKLVQLRTDTRRELDATPFPGEADSLREGDQADQAARRSTGSSTSSTGSAPKCCCNKSNVHSSVSTTVAMAFARIPGNRSTFADWKRNRPPR